MHNYMQSTLSFLKRRTVIAVLGTISIQAFAQGTVNIPAQALGTSLSSLAKQSNVNILAPEDLVAGHLAPPVSGQLSVDEILNRLLAGSGLVYQRNDDRTFVIKPSTTKQEPQVLPEINVNSVQTTTGGGLIATSTSTVTKSDTPIAETPQNVQVITQTAIRDQAAQSITEALQSVSGVTVQAINPAVPVVYIRGMQASTTTNGGNDNSQINSLNLPISAVERIEVIKGADAILTGMMNPGGSVNIITKQPTATPVRELTLQTGSYGDLLTAIDLGGPITSDAKLTYRFNMSGERTSETSGGFDGTRDFFFSPSIGWKSDGTEVTLQYIHNVNHLPPVPVTLVNPDGDPIKLSGRAENSSTTLSQDDTVQFNFKQRIIDGLDFVSKTSYENRVVRQSNDASFPALLLSPDMAVYSLSGQRLRIYSTDTDNHIQYEYKIGEVQQTLTAGVDYNVSWFDDLTGGSSLIAPFPSVNLPPVTGPFTYQDRGKSYFNTAYVQDQLRWDRLHIVAGIARSAYWSESDASQSKWLPSVGVLYQLTDSLAIYGNDLRSFEPQSEPTAAGGITPPQSGHSVEAGFKLSLLNDDLSIDASAFRTAIDNEAIENLSTGFYESVGHQVTRGFDVTIKGQVTRGLRVQSSYTYSNAQVAAANYGKPAQHAGNLWVFYDFPGQALHGLGVGVGVTASTKSELSDSSGTYKLPGQAQTDMTVYYRAKKWSATLAVKNIFDRTLYQFPATPWAELQPGRLVYLTGRYNF